MQENPNFSSETQAPSGDPRLKGASPTTFYLSIFVLAVVVIFSALMYIFAFTTRGEIDTYSNRLADLDGKIASARQNKTILIADILSKNLVRPSIDLKKLVTDFRMAARLSGVRFQGFNIQWDVISTNLIASQSIDTNIHNDPALTIIRMIRTYHDRAQDDSGFNLFSLEPIKTIEWDLSARRTSIEFKIIPSPSSNQ